MKGNRISKLKSKKTKDIIFTLAYTILSELRFGVTTNSELVTITGEKKQNIRYWLDKLCDEGLAKKVDYGCYKGTGLGKKIHDQCERLRNKQCIRIENVRISYTVYEGLESIKTGLGWSVHEINNGVEIYQLYYKDHLIRMIQGKHKRPTLEISCWQSLDTNPYDAYFDARMPVEQIADELESKFNVRLSRGFTSTQPELAVPTPLAEALLQVHGASQIRTSKGIINRSKGRNADLEPMTLQQAQRVVNMPDYVEEIFGVVDYLQDKVEHMEKWMQEIVKFQKDPFGSRNYN